jgi:hypothetical protein
VTSNMKIEKKTIVQTVVVALLSALISVLNAVQDNPALLGNIPTWAQTVILLVMPTVLAYLAGYVTPTTVRDDPAAQRQARKVGLAVVPRDRAA